MPRRAKSKYASCPVFDNYGADAGEPGGDATKTRHDQDLARTQSIHGPFMCRLPGPGGGFWKGALHVVLHYMTGRGSMCQ